VAPSAITWPPASKTSVMMRSCPTFSFFEIWSPSKRLLLLRNSLFSLSRVCDSPRSTLRKTTPSAPQQEDFSLATTVMILPVPYASATSPNEPPRCQVCVTLPFTLASKVPLSATKNKFPKVSSFMIVSPASNSKYCTLSTIALRLSSPKAWHIRLFFSESVRKARSASPSSRAALCFISSASSPSSPRGMSSEAFEMLR